MPYLLIDLVHASLEARSGDSSGGGEACTYIPSGNFSLLATNSPVDERLISV
jgi:hypothetical protein